MELRQLVKEVPYLLETKGDMSVEIAALCSNSREKTENGIFSALPAHILMRISMPRRRCKMAAWRWWWNASWTM